MKREEEKLTVTVSGGTIQDVDQVHPSGRGPVGQGAVVEFATPRAKLIEEADAAIRRDLAPFPKALAAYDTLSRDPEALACWDMANYITMRKLGYNDHGRVHAWVTGAASMAILDLLVQGGVKPDLVESGLGDLDDAYLAVIVGTMLHDIGNQIHRVAHEAHGVTLALPIVDRVLTPIYPDAFKRTKVRAFVLHCIDCHDLNPTPLTIEGGVTAVADGIDITKGRGRKAFALGSVDIHSISALAVDNVTISRGADRPVRIDVTMNNSGGIFQVEEILAPKVIRSPLARHVTLRARMRPGGEERILDRVRLEGDHFVMDLESGEEVVVAVDTTTRQVEKDVERQLGGTVEPGRLP
ncbi:phosphohydrolase [Deinococcus pimensis]|uniref:phosphohydrolase n=1 Tax=Deinococcus pimensis TaxID=309888 RepID=UPI000484207E|nr:phosphohydrolase [Deinococcus pimensis]